MHVRIVVLENIPTREVNHARRVLGDLWSTAHAHDVTRVLQESIVKKVLLYVLCVKWENIALLGKLRARFALRERLPLVKDQVLVRSAFRASINLVILNANFAKPVNFPREMGRPNVTIVLIISTHTKGLVHVGNVRSIHKHRVAAPR
ncbi:MAG: hypothetical protein EBR09_16410 [Proteobacteria bacterium]|nr:hypothetical protein [Pseudomonadota bacterium]